GGGATANLAGWVVAFGLDEWPSGRDGGLCTRPQEWCITSALWPLHAWPSCVPLPAVASVAFVPWPADTILTLVKPAVWRSPTGAPLPREPSPGPSGRAPSRETSRPPPGAFWVVSGAAPGAMV